MQLQSLIAEKKYAQVRQILIEENVVDIAEYIGELEDDLTLLILFRLLPKEMAADVFSYLDSDHQQRIVEGLTEKELSSIVDDLFLDDTVDFLEEMPASIVKRVIKAADQDKRRQINQLLMYPESSAGSLMTIEFMELEYEWNVKHAIEAIRRQCDDKESVTTCFVTDDSRHLQGSIRLRTILMNSDSETIGDLMDTEIISVNTHDNQEDVAEMFKKYDLLSMPVVDNENRLVGLITIDDVVDVMEEETTEDIYKMAAMEPIEQGYLETGVFTLARKRIGWLMVLMISATFTGTIIKAYDGALQANVLLAAFIPMLMDTGGNAGSQSSVSVIRGIVLGEIKFRDIFRVMWKEMRVSLIVGAVIALFNFIRLAWMEHDFQIAIVVAATLYVTIMIAKIVGSVLPLIAQKFKFDPVLMASPLITTIVDALVLIVYFNIASLVLPEITL